MAHVDAGKTSFSEQLLYHTNSIRKRGRVDHQDAFLDNHAIEKNRGITVFADQAIFTYGESTYTLIDTPGHVDFSPEMERAIQVMDYAIVIVSAVEGVEGHTETVWQLLRKHKVPTFFFINKTDREGANVERVLNDIRLNLSGNVYDFTSDYKDGVMAENLVEFIAERDEILLERYFEGDYDEAVWYDALKKMIQNNELFVCMSGSALQDIGIVEFLATFDGLTATSYANDGLFTAKVYKIRHDDNGNRVTFLKSLSGVIRTRDEITYREQTEKVTGIRLYNGRKYEAIDQASAGTIFAVTGLSALQVGDRIGIEGRSTFELIPTLTSTVLFDASIHVKEVFQFFKQLDAEDPSLRVLWDEHFSEIHVHVMGTIQLEVLKQVVAERFGIDVAFGTPKILYKETIAAPVIGYGHFEPLRHYAEVHLKIEPAQRNVGVLFENACHANDLLVGHQNLVQHHIYEREHHGLLTGSSLTDVKITLLTGRGHNEHTAGGDFREATYRALRQGLEQVENILLEPYYIFKIKVELDLMGRVLSDIQQAYGRFEPPETIGHQTVITGTVPVATFMDYSTTFASITGGKGALSLKFSGYDICHNADEVIEMIGYDKNADPEYTSTSIFCAKGKGYPVPWDEAKAAMHCE